MSKKRHHKIKVYRHLLNKSVTNREYKIRLKLVEYPPYWDGDYTWKVWKFPNHKRRSYKTWKHTRKTQWKS